jgi:hypothetical protein
MSDLLSDHDHRRDHGRGRRIPGRRPRLAGRCGRPRRGVHGPARHHDRDGRAARDQDRPARLARHPGVGRLRLRARLRPRPGPGGPGRGPVWPQAVVPRRAGHLYAGQRGLRAVAEPGRNRRRPRGPGHWRRDLLPGHRRDHSVVVHRGSAVEGVRRPRRHDRRVHRPRAGAWRPDHRGRGCPRRLALGVPGEPVHRRGRAAGGRQAAAPRANAHPPPVRPGRALPAVRRAAPAAHPAGGRRAGGLACLVLRVLRRLRGRVRAAGLVGGAARTRCSSRACWLGRRSPPGQSSPSSISPGSPACSSPSRSSGRKGCPAVR